jgi:hypothetical protein
MHWLWKYSISLKSYIFCAISRVARLKISRRYGRTCRLYLHGILFTLYLDLEERGDAGRLFERAVISQTIELTLHKHRCKNVRSWQAESSPVTDCSGCLPRCSQFHNWNENCNVASDTIYNTEKGRTLFPPPPPRSRYVSESGLSPWFQTPKLLQPCPKRATLHHAFFRTLQFSYTHVLHFRYICFPSSER